MEHEEQAEELERDADKLDQHSDVVEEHIDEARREWESKEDDPMVPGAQPAPDEEEESVPGVAADEDTLRDEPGP